MPRSSTTQINMSYTSIIRMLLVIAAAFIIYLIRDALALLFVSLIFSAAVDPWVDWLQKRRIPRALSILMIYVVFLTIFSVIIAMMIPPITEQIGQVVKSLPNYYEKISIGLNSLKDQTPDSAQAVGSRSIVSALETLSSSLAETTRSIFVTITGIFGGLMSLIVVLVITFYLVVEEDGLKKFIRLIIPVKHRNYTMNLIERMQLKIGLWLRGQLLLSVVVGALCYIGLLIFGVKYALLLAVIAGILEIIPYLGPWVSGALAVVVAFTDGSFWKIVLVASWYILVQQAENSVIVPKLMQKVVGLNPIITIMAVMIGFKLGGIVGGLLGVPVAAAIAVYFTDILKVKSPENTDVG